MRRNCSMDASLDESDVSTQSETSLKIADNCHQLPKVGVKSNSCSA